MSRSWDHVPHRIREELTGERGKPSFQHYCCAHIIIEVSEHNNVQGKKHKYTDAEHPVLVLHPPSCLSQRNKESCSSSDRDMMYGDHMYIVGDEGDLFPGHSSQKVRERAGRKENGIRR